MESHERPMKWMRKWPKEVRHSEKLASKAVLTHTFSLLKDAGGYRRHTEVREMYAHLPLQAPAKPCDSICCLEEVPKHHIRALEQQVACPENSHGVSTMLGCICNKASIESER